LSPVNLRGLSRGLEAELDALFFQQALQRVGHFAIGGGRMPSRNSRTRTSAQAAPDAAEFDADVTAADDDEALGDLRQREGFGGRENEFAVEFEAGQLDRRAAGGDENALGFVGCPPPAAGDFDGVRRDDAPLPTRWSILFLLKRKPTPPVIFLTTSSLKAIMAGDRPTTPETLMPRRA
jgi:hypothetical protein